DTATGLRFGDGSSYPSCSRIAGPGDRTIRCSPNGPQLHTRYQRGWRGARTRVTNSFHGQPPSRGGDDGLGKRGASGRGYAARRFRFYPEAVAQSPASPKIAEPAVLGTDAAAGGTSAQRRTARGS